MTLLFGLVMPVAALSAVTALAAASLCQRRPLPNGSGSPQAAGASTGTQGAVALPAAWLPDPPWRRETTATLQRLRHKGPSPSSIASAAAATAILSLASPAAGWNFGVPLPPLLLPLPAWQALSSSPHGSHLRSCTVKSFARQQLLLMCCGMRSRK